MVRPEELNPEVSIKDFETKAKEVCGLTFDEAKEKYRGVKEKYLRNICVDLTYQYAFLVDGLSKFFCPFKFLFIEKNNR